MGVAGSSPVSCSRFASLVEQLALRGFCLPTSPGLARRMRSMGIAPDDLIAKADGATARMILGPKYLYCLRDNNAVYISSKRLDEADPRTCEFWKAEDDLYFLRDSIHMWTVEPGSPHTVRLVW